MIGRDDEEELLRSVATLNENTIRLARQRAEEELVRAKESLELRTQGLAHSLSMMRATLESTTDGILVTDGAAKITSFNERYARMCGVSPDVMASGEHHEILAVIGRLFADPKAFQARIDEIYATSPPESFDVLHLADGSWSVTPKSRSWTIGRSAEYGAFATSRSGAGRKTRCATRPASWSS